MLRLSATARAAGHRLHAHESLPSTNAQGLALARGGEPGPLWIVAKRQSEGRGRRGAAWISPEGNLAASLLLPLTGIAPERMATLGFVAGLALALALDDMGQASRSEAQVPSPEGERDRVRGVPSPARAEPSPQPSPGRERGSVEPNACFRLKWPNDVLADGKKIAGILLEAEGRRAVVVGFGVNVAAAPDGLPYPATSLAALGCMADAAALFEALTERFVETAGIWNKGRGFPDIRQAWMERAAGIGDPVTVRLPGGGVTGRHQGIDEEGRLMILAPDGQTRTVTAGEVHFGEAATAA